MRWKFVKVQKFMCQNFMKLTKSQKSFDYKAKKV